MKFGREEYTIAIWKGEHLGSLVACDTETTIVPFTRTPDLVTCQVYGGGDVVYYIPKNRITTFFIKHYDTDFIFHNAPFDMDVLQSFIGRDAVYRMYDDNKIKDTSILYRLVHLAEIGMMPHRYNLALVSKKFNNVELEKDERRENFAQFKDVDIDQIPEYGAADVIATYKAWLTMKVHANRHDVKGTLLSHDIQVKGDLALKHLYKNGIGFDLSMKDEWFNDKNGQLVILQERLSNWGWVRGHKGIKDRYAQITEILGIKDKLPRTKDGSISAKREDLEPFSHLPFISDFLSYIELEKAIGFVKDRTESRVHPRYNTLVNTGRTSCSKPNFQQLPRIGGIREMFKADEGKTFLITDYSTLELAALSQVLLDQEGYSVMGDKINEGIDLHKYYASVMHGCTLDKVTKQQRQEAKAANFGFPGGLGVETFIQFSKGYGLTITPQQAQIMKNTWFDAFPEIKGYMKNEKGEVTTLTGRKRGNTTYCAEKNTPFQGLSADGAKLALYNLDKEGFKVVGFVHDEIICEVKCEEATEKLKVMEKIMIDQMRGVIPDIKIGVDSMISDRYCK